MILGINTAQPIHELAILERGKLLAEKTWPDDRRDVEDLVPFLKALLEEHGLSKKDITQIVMVRGPGSFTSLRTGVAFANALAEGLCAKLYFLDTFALLKRKAATTNPTLVILNAGGLDVGIQFNDEAIRVGHLAHLLNDYPHDKNMYVITELTETQREELNSIVREKNWKLIEGHELQTMGESLVILELEGLQKVKVVEPYYLKTPSITKSSDKWKR